MKVFKLILTAMAAIVTVAKGTYALIKCLGEIKPEETTEA